MSDERVERRLAAVLAADVAGYSRLMGLDEEGTLARLKAVRKALVDPTIASHRGRIVKTTGDGMLVEFASAVDGVRCGAEVQRGMAALSAADPADRRIEFRIGIHVGDIIIDDNDIFGDGVNIAARLEGIAEPGGICISDDTQRQIRGKVDVVFEHMGLQTLKNIAEPIMAWRMAVAGSVSVPVLQKTHPDTANLLAFPDKPSIAVLPFQNMSGDLEQEYFADGMVEDITTALSRFKSLLVIARNTSSIYKGKAVDIKQVGRELGVRYVLEGSVRKANGRVRITGQLIEAETGAHLWGGKIDGALEDVFDLQDKVTSSVVGAIAPAMQFAEAARTKRKPTASLDSYDLLLRGMALFGRGRAKEAVNYFRKAIEKDDQYAEAYGMFAAACLVWQSYGMAPIPATERAEALRCAKLAATLGNNDAAVLARAAQALVYFGDEHERGCAMINRAVALNPNLSSAWQARGWIYGMCGNIDEGVKSFFQVLRFSELDTNRSGACSGISWGCFHQGKFEEGCAWAEKALQKGQNALYFLPLIINLVKAERKDEARKAAARLLELVPSFRMSRFSEVLGAPADHQQLFIKVLREAGLPE